MLSQLRDWHLDDLDRKGRTQKHRKGVEYLWGQLIDRLGELEPSRITYEHVVGYVDARSSEVKGQTIRKELQALKRGLVEAKRRGHRTPDIAWPTVESSPANEDQAGRLHPIADLRRWLDELRASKKAPPHAAIQAEVCLLTGLRHMEVRRLRLDWLEVAPEGSPAPLYLRVPALAAKNRRERIVACTWRVADLLQHAQDLTDEGERLVPGYHRRAFEAASKRAGIAHVVSLRDLRHCYATYSSEVGDIVATQTALGHADVSTTSRYLHGTGDRTAAASLHVAAMLKASGGDPKVGTPPGKPDAQSGDIRASMLVMCGRGSWIRTSDFLLPKREVHAAIQLLRSFSCAPGVLAALECADEIASEGDPKWGPLEEAG